MTARRMVTVLDAEGLETDEPEGVVRDGPGAVPHREVGQMAVMVSVAV
ncbi:hypothetical protein Apa02nite_023330 [Actinoplanes palleronii]|uniref:Uncharacterized protein n=1 Tax=Actinoplanes palleronii TaxID=113570 RepID=A0ABQ4B6G6_9ACTN|nr:hypothetical protein Apa02nite_023330 [Actinoplanes palleronii]